MLELFRSKKMRVGEILVMNIFLLKSKSSKNFISKTWSSKLIFLKKSKMKCLWSVKSWLYYEKLLSNFVDPVKNLQEAVQQRYNLIAISWQVDEQVKAHFWWVAKVVIRFEHEFFILINSKGTKWIQGKMTRRKLHYSEAAH